MTETQTLDIASFVKETIVRTQEEWKQKKAQDAEKRKRHIAETAAMAQKVKSILGHISVELKSAVEQSPELQKLLAHAGKALWRDIPNSRVIVLPDSLYASYPRVVAWCLVGHPLEEEPSWQLVLAHHYDGVVSWQPAGEAEYEYVTGEELEKLETLLEPRALIEKIIPVLIT